MKSWIYCNNVAWDIPALLNASGFLRGVESKSAHHWLMHQLCLYLNCSDLIPLVTRHWWHWGWISATCFIWDCFWRLFWNYPETEQISARCGGSIVIRWGSLLVYFSFVCTGWWLFSGIIQAVGFDIFYSLELWYLKDYILQYEIVCPMRSSVVWAERDTSLMGETMWSPLGKELYCQCSMFRVQQNWCHMVRQSRHSCYLAKRQKSCLPSPHQSMRTQKKILRWLSQAVI